MIWTLLPQEFLEEKSRDEFSDKVKLLSTQTQMKTLSLPEKKPYRVLDRNKTSKLKWHFNKI